jgi:hypothetical protein
MFHTTSSTPSPANANIYAAGRLISAAKQASHFDAIHARNREIVRAYDRSESIGALAREYHLGRGTIRQILRDHNRVAMAQHLPSGAMGKPFISEGGGGGNAREENRIFVQRLLKYYLRRDQHPESMDIVTFIDRCQKFGLIVPDAYANIVAETAHSTGFGFTS